MNFSIYRVLLLSALALLSFSVSAEQSHNDHASHNLAEITDIADIGNSNQPSDVIFKYVCPMHPQIIRDHEGICPICGMDLVRQQFEASMAAPKIKAETSADGIKHGFSVRTAEVQKTMLWKYIPTFGRVVADESKVVHIHPRSSGWISGLSVRSNGEEVKKGQLLYRLYSPEILSAQQDFILALQSRQRIGQKAKSLVESAKVRLSLLGVSKSTIKSIEKRLKPLDYVPVYAKQSGIVSNLIVQNGMFVEPKTELMTISDLSTVWVEAEILPLQQEWIKTGLTVELTSAAYPKENWESQIDYIYPVADAAIQVTKVRLPVLNQDLKLKLNMLIDVAIYGGPKRDVLAIPFEAVIDDGLRKRVVTQLEDGNFQVREVVTGMQTKGIVEIDKGLEVGEIIVVSGQFLIDSESQIQENLKRLISQPKPVNRTAEMSSAQDDHKSHQQDQQKDQHNAVDHSMH